MLSSWILTVFWSMSIFFSNNIDCVPTAAVQTRQFLYAKPGFVPVFIRTGDTPLEEINPDLAEAFNVYDQKHGKIFHGRYVDDKVKHRTKDINENHKKFGKAIEEAKDTAKNEVDSNIPQHIQKIPSKKSRR